MSIADILIYATLFAIAITISWSGFLQQVISLLTLVFAVWAGFYFAEPIGQLFEGYLHIEWLRNFAGGAVVTVLMLAVGFWLVRLSLALVHMLGLSWLNKLLGFVLGLLIGLVIVWMSFAGAAMAPLNPPITERDWWKNSHAVYFVLSRAQRVFVKMGIFEAEVPKPKAQPNSDAKKTVTKKPAQDEGSKIAPNTKESELLKNNTDDKKVSK